MKICFVFYDKKRSDALDLYNFANIKCILNYIKLIDIDIEFFDSWILYNNQNHQKYFKFYATMIGNSQLLVQNSNWWH